MQELNMRQGNCRRLAQAEQATNCTQKLQRVRCCGRVFSEQEVSLERIENGQGKGQGKRMANGQGKGQGKRMANGQGKRMA
jgi:hypothetical protein